MSQQHRPARQCPECEGFCLRPATVDEANTALAIATTLDERLFAAEALAEAASVMAKSLLRARVEIRNKAARSTA